MEVAGEELVKENYSELVIFLGAGCSLCIFNIIIIDSFTLILLLSFGYCKTLNVRMPFISLTKQN